MNVYNSIDNFPGSANAVVTIGTFDGVHIGHQQIIRNLRKLAAETHGETVLLTFFPHPRMVLQPDDNDLKLITTMVEREELLRSFGIDHLIIQPFDKEFSRISATEFVRDQLMQKIGMKTLVIGYDHHFGRNREGSYKDLEEMAPVYGFRLEEINEQVINHIAVSSTKVRKALLEGDIDSANQLLGHRFSFRGKVVMGDKIGRTLGFPTANIEIPEAYKLVPAEGIYAVQIRIGQQLKKGMLYIGTRPVVNGKSLRIEVNIFEFDQEIYNQEIQVMFVSRIRGDLPFTDINALKEKMKEDKVIATKLLS
ncbi:MAG: bifunctional riboflavin kinase/FAD synthetase [Bacteroidia bacterium]|nr:bifunctional riboflavin kinase/FAD synthetase [Bacteroidota bacterium]MBK8586513.1 bifunctional riboflavin kinase/FAD synthetase [Bacteroidota bacterium]MBP9788951.1 bifunctional riboflavin kinase/FAD synthetase [Bacteroidia bacterium]MBP9923550.1 bifunctional riboflavin kinase/FAD synthetase [Bacteroidia bacterium]